MSTPLSPRDEILGLFIVAHTTDDRIVAATGISKTRINGFRRGYRELSIVELAKIRQFLIGTIQRLVSERDSLESVGLADLLPKVTMLSML